MVIILIGHTGRATLTLLVPYALLITSLPPPCSNMILVNLSWWQSKVEEMIE